MAKEKINLLFCGHDLRFIQPFIDKCQNSDFYNFRILTYSGHDIRDEHAAKEALNWAHVIFCEWALGNASWFSQCKRPDQILIVRLHLQEIQSRDRTNYIWEIDWSQVDRLVLITHYIYDWIRSKFPTISNRCSLIYNPIPAKGKLNQIKDSDSRYVLGLVGIVPARKRLDIAVEILRGLLRYNSKYILRIKGALPTEYGWMLKRTDEMNWYKQVFDELSDLKNTGHIVFEPHGPNMENWYREIGQLLSVSDFEGSHQAIAESMSSGSVPVIRNWEGSSRIYPSKYVRSSIDEMVELIRENSSLETFKKESEFCRKFAHQQFDEKEICSQLEAIIHQELLTNYKSKAHKISNPKKRHILPSFLVIAYIPIGSRNGYRIRVEQEIKILKRHGCKVHLACLVPIKDYQNDNSGEIEHIKELKSLGCEVHLLPVHDIFSIDDNITPFYPVINQIAMIMKSANTDIIHAEALYCARIAGEVRKILPDIIFSVDWHGLVPEETKLGGAHENRIKILTEIEENILKKSDINIIVSKKMEEYYKSKYNLKNIKSTIIPCCISDNFINNTSHVKIDGIHDKHLVFGYIGSMAEWQCGAEMIRLFSQLYKIENESRFVLLVPRSDQTKLYEFIKREGLSKQSYTIQEVTHYEISTWIKSFHVGVLLRKNDPVNLVSSPTKYAEYLAAGIPVLMTDCIGDYSEHAKKRNVGLVIPGNILENENIPSRILSGILDMARNSRLRRQNVIKKCQDAAQELSWEFALRKWIDAYQNIFKLL